MLNPFKTWFDKPKPTQYYFVKNGVERKVSTDPKGWEDDAIGLARGDYHGMDREIGFDLEFFGTDAEYLKSLFDVTGFNTELNLKVVVQNNDLSLEDFIVVNMDFSAYYSNPKTYSVTVPVKKIGLAQIIETHKSTEYQFDFPADNECEYIQYTGLTREATNDIVLGVGSFYNAYGEYSQRIWPINGSRVNRNYSSHLKFTRDDGSPFDTCKFIATTSGFVNLHVVLKMRIAMEGAFGYGASFWGDVYIVKNRTGYTPSTMGDAIAKFHAYDRYRNDNFSREYYNIDETFPLYLEAGSLYELVYRSDLSATGFHEDPYIPMDGIDKAYMTFTEMATSPFQDYNIKGVTFEWMARKIIEKMYSDYYGNIEGLDFNFNIPRYVLDMLTSASAMRNLSEKRIKCTWEKLIENLHKINCISVISEDNSIYIGSIGNAYKGNVNTEIIPCNNIDEKVDTKHIYNAIEVGTSFSVNSQDEKNGQKEPLCKNTYTIVTKNVTDEKKYDLVLDFICSPTQIEEYMTTSREEEGVSKEGDNDIYMFACENNGGRYHKLYRNVSILSCELDHATVFNLAYSPKRLILAHQNYLSISTWRANPLVRWQSSDYNHTLNCKFNFESDYIQEGTDFNLPTFCWFNPMVISADICQEIRSMNDVKGDNAYRLVRLKHIETGEIFQGFMDKATFSVQYKMKKQIELKGYDIN